MFKSCDVWYDVPQKHTVFEYRGSCGSLEGLKSSTIWDEGTSPANFVVTSDFNHRRITYSFSLSVS